MGNYLVTGAGGGMGRALCAALTAQGHRVWGVDNASEEAETGRHIIRADIRSAEELNAAFETVKAEARELDGIVTLAGVYDLGSLIEMPEERFVRDFDVNLFGAFRVNKLFVPLLRRNGRIVIVTSELAPLEPLPFTGIYGVTKTALDKYAAALRMELQLLGISVTAVRPGAVRTAMLPASTQKLDAFCDSTEHYRFNAGRFRGVVYSVEARSVSPERIAARITKVLAAKRPPNVVNINRNPLLLLLNALPMRTQLFIIRRILSGGEADGKTDKHGTEER